MNTNNASKLRIIAAYLLSGSLFFAAGSASAGGDAKAGEAASKTCAACHGEHGIPDTAANSANASNPKLAGQYESYIVQALKAYRSGARQSAIMSGFAAGLTDQQIADLAAYFSSQESDLQMQTVVPK